MAILQDRGWPVNRSDMGRVWDWLDAARQRPTQQAATDRAAVEAVLALHPPHTEKSGKVACPTCLLDYPCPTVRAANPPADP